MTLQQLCSALRASRGFVHKRDIGGVVGALAASVAIKAPGIGAAVPVGDDCAAIPLSDAQGGEGYLLLAIEGLVEDFIARMPWFAGYCSVMVNVSDIYAMGGRPIAVVDALWSTGIDAAQPMLQGMAAAAERYGVPIVGGHSNNQSLRGQLAVAILGRAQRLLTSFDARPGDTLLMAVDLRGSYQEPYPYWNASTGAPAHRLRADLEILPSLAEDGLCDAAKDISMAGVLGTLLMLLECSKVGATVELDHIPRPDEACGDEAWLRWLSAFPSYGFVLSVRPAQAGEVQRRFAARGLACAPIGQVQASSRLLLRQGGDEAVLWDTAEAPFICPAASPEAAHA
ncbi:MAG TPA: sll0787 family AIR synthase-like protein [Ideonella sp.]|nr:sll0787 family AIR synthase-like protein [Ideonella sp.]